MGASPRGDVAKDDRAEHGGELGMNLTREGDGWQRTPAVSLAQVKRAGPNAVLVSQAIVDRVADLQGRLLPADVRVEVTRDYNKDPDAAILRCLDHAGVGAPEQVWRLGERPLTGEIAALICATSPGEKARRPPGGRSSRAVVRFPCRVRPGTCRRHPARPGPGHPRLGP